MKDFKIDISRIPFSRYGAYVSVTAEQGSNTLTIHNVRRRCDESPAYTLNFFCGGKEADIEVYANPDCVYVESESGSGRIYIRDDQTVVVDTEGLDLVFTQLSRNGYGGPEGGRAFKMISVNQSIYYFFYAQKGAGTMEDLENADDYSIHRNQKISFSCEDKKCTVALKASIIEPKEILLPIETEKEIHACSEEWESFCGRLPEHRQTGGRYEEITWYNLWSSFVRAEDVYRYDTMLMSKKFMTSVWSWDHCFNALAMAKVSKKTALEQFCVPFAMQSETGALPDMLNPNSEIIWGVTKPPIHGWCFSKLMELFEFTEEELQMVYGYLEKWTNWWMEYRDSDHDGIPDYPQGCDSGWDNATLFDLGYFMETPDLPALLVLQMQALSGIAGRLSKSGDDLWGECSKKWLGEADALLKRFYEHSWNGKRFIAKQSRTHKYEENPTSLLALMPLVLGEQLDEEKRKKLAVILKEDFLTEHGLATESPGSDKYDPDGYWRGPIWAPNTYLLIDGLRRGGETELAEDIARRFCKTARDTAKGNYENYDALTGQGLRAPGYTWTASVYMLLSWEYDL